MNNSSILNFDPFILEKSEKEELFLQEMKKSTGWHYENCQDYKLLCDNRNFSPVSSFKLADIPYLPVSIFKTREFLSVPKEKITRTLFSSSTSGVPSKILLDDITIKNQITALGKILKSFLGADRRHFIVFDTEKTIKSTGDGELNSRGTAIRGMFPMAKSVDFILNDDLSVNHEKLKAAAEKLSNDEKLCFFGFTWLIYSIYSNNKKNRQFINHMRKITGNKDALMLHIGGWKKLKDIAVTKDRFNSDVAEMLGTKPGKIIDMYGMTEQLGTVYPDCEFGYKHIPAYSELIIRNIDTLEPAEMGEIGFIQFLSPLPHSYPGISILSDDMGKIIGVDTCKCGRKGAYFVFEKRSEKAELKGCGDTLQL